MVGKYILIISLISCVLPVSQTLASPIADLHLKVGDVEKLNVDNAASDAKTAIARGDNRLLAVYGITLLVPGAPDYSKSDIWRDRRGLKVLDGTSDAPRNAEDARFNENAFNYATKYNRVILSKNR